MRRGGIVGAALAVAVLAGGGVARAQVPAPYLDWPSLLPALGAPFTPDREPDCADGADSCIDRTIGEMGRRLDTVVPVCDHRAVFSLAYLRVTEDVRAARRAGLFRDPAWLNREDAVFARLYFAVYDAYAAGRSTGVPTAWRLAFDSERGRELSALGDFLMSMNAHINRDMPFVLAGIGITRPDGTTRKGDHDVYNARLAALYVPVLREVARRFDPTADDIDAGPVDDVLAAGILQSWREGVWRNAERLVTAGSPARRALVADSIEAYATAVGRSIRGLTRSDPRPRDAWCATHGGQRPVRAAGAATGPGRVRITAVALQTASRAREVRVPLACPATAGDCRGRILVRLPHGGALLTRVPYRLAAGTARTIAIDLRALQRRQARRRRAIRITLTRAGIAGAGARTSRVVRVR